ncbi:MAG: bifunctional serine/threonine-protein kinase/formylglycine-generating enzyme family protein [Polyangiales bacterium]
MPRFSLTPGEVFAGDYEAVDRVGEGGFGSVWRVRQRSTGRLRALKLLRAEALLDDDARARFAAEATASARIESEHVVQVLQAGVEPDGTPWIAMELLDGRTLADAVAQGGPLGFADVVDVARQVAHALDAAHRVGVVHRDLKPENVFVAESRRADAARTVKLLDFGIAKVLGDARRTAASAVIGTPLWMAPEQFEQRVSPAVDVWAFGLVAYYALAGRPYWESAAQGYFAVVDEIRREGRDPVARARRAGRELPPGFDAWFARCTAVDPRRRFDRAGDAYAALAALGVATAPTQLAPTRAAPPTPPPLATPLRFVAQAPTERLPPPRRRWPWLAGAGLVAALGLAAVVLPRLAQVPTTTDPRPLTPVFEAPPSPGRCPAGMAFIPGGSVTLATHVQYPVRGYCLDLAEATASSYASCVAAGRCAAITAGLRAGVEDNVCNATRAGFEAHPINCLTVAEAESYCAWREARLPTSPEWELAATGPANARAYPWGADEPTGVRANTCGVECAERTGTALGYSGADDYPTTAPAGALREGASPQGVLDLGGNVAEWVAAGPWDFSDGKRTVRGGQWLDPPARSHVAVRRVWPAYRGRSIGVRCAADAR